MRQAAPLQLELNLYRDGYSSLAVQDYLELMQHGYVNVETIWTFARLVAVTQVTAKNVWILFNWRRHDSPPGEFKKDAGYVPIEVVEQLPYMRTVVSDALALYPRSFSYSAIPDVL